jgi:hypothetical protein
MCILRTIALCVATSPLLSCATVDQRTSGPSAFLCSTDTFAWVQLTPCRATTTEKRGEQQELPDGGRIYIDYGVEVPVQQAELSHEEACAKLKLGPDKAGWNAEDTATMLSEAKCD